MGTGPDRPAGGPRPGGPSPLVRALALGLARYRYGIALASAILLGLALLPSNGPDGAAAGAGSGPGGFTVIDPQPGKRPAARAPGRPAPAPPATGMTTGGAEAAPAGGGTVAAPRPSATTTTGRSRRAAGAAGAGGAGAAPIPLPDPACDALTGRLAVPTRSAPPCVVPVAANGGATWPGVTAETITVAVYLPRGDVASSALAAAAGNRDTEGEVAATYRSYTDYFEHHYQTWGRRLRLAFVTASGADDDARSARADAVKVATRVGAFASWGGPARTSAYADELAGRQVLCVCAVPEPDAWYQARAPFVISPEATVTQRIGLQTDYVVKRLAGRHARFAGDVMLAAQTRTFGLVYEDSRGQEGLRAAEALERALRRAGVELLDSVGFGGGGSPGPGGNAAGAGSEDARRVVSRLRQAGVTSVLYVGDGLFPAFMTQEATRQSYSPEWVLLGAGPAGGGGAGAGTGRADTAFAGRRYDQTQWSRAFGLSFAGARLAPGQGEAWRVHTWHTGRPPPARASHALVYRSPWLFFTGMHLGGPVVTPASIHDGLSRLPPVGGMVTSPSVSFGRHGLWPGDDHGAGDDVTELWWDPAAPGVDEAGAQGLGMYRYADGGRRYLPGSQPEADTAAFNRTNAVTGYDEPPPSDRPPSYLHQP